ncbi:MAG TPA: hypothetical protein VHW01_24105 [Polyangiaceae bacterium]|nr:hypothetical protein [Polyangiaceae bacterium]
MATECPGNAAPGAEPEAELDAELDAALDDELAPALDVARGPAPGAVLETTRRGTHAPA